MNSPDLGAQMEQYRVALDAQLALLGRLRTVALRQQALSRANDLAALQRTTDERDGLMAGLLAIEQQIQGVRAALADARDAVRRLPAFSDLVALYRKVTETVSAVLDTDRDSIRALEDFMAERRLAAQALEQGESTLAAYSRLATQPPAATLVNRRG